MFVEKAILLTSIVTKINSKITKPNHKYDYQKITT